MQKHYNQEMVGLLPAYRYDTEGRRRLLRDLEAMYLLGTPDVIEAEIDVSKSDMMIGYEVYRNLHQEKFDYKTEIMRCFLLLCDNVVREDVPDGVLVTYNGRMYMVRTLVANSFFFHQLYLIGSRVPKVVSDIQLNLTRVVELLPARKEAVNGQMKIMVDAVLAMDDMIMKESDVTGKRILIVGSSHEPGFVPKSSYYPLFFMVTGCEFHMYDMLEVDGEEEINGNKVCRYSRPYSYLDMHLYDLMLDDAWISGRTALESIVIPRSRSPDVMDVYPRHYSLKAFSSTVPGIYYSQVGSTHVGERRLVSRVLFPRYKKDDMLGRCAFCRELKYFKRRLYSSPFYERVMMCHKNNSCVPPSMFYLKRRVGELFLQVGAQWIVSSSFSYDAVSRLLECDDGRKFVRLIVDSVFSNDSIEHREEHVRVSHIILSSFDMLTSVIRSARSVVVMQGKVFYEIYRPGDREKDQPVEIPYTLQSKDYIATQVAMRANRVKERKAMSYQARVKAKDVVDNVKLVSNIGSYKEFKPVVVEGDRFYNNHVQREIDRRTLHQGIMDEDEE